MAKLLVRAGFWLRAGLGLAVAALPVCYPAPAYAQAPNQVPGRYWLLASRNKKTAPPEPPRIKASQPPALTIPVEQFGFSAPGPFYLGSRSSLVSLDFLDEDRLLFTFRIPGLIHRNLDSSDNGDERQIRALVIRLPEGTLQAEALWKLRDATRYMYTTNDGHFLLRDRDNLKLGDATLQLKPFLQFPGPILWVEQDPSRQYLVTGSAEPPGEKPKAGDVPRPATAAATVLGEEDRSTRDPDMVLRVLRRDSGKVMLVSHVRSAVHLPINTDGYLEVLRSKGMGWVVNLNYFKGGSIIVGKVDSVCTPKMDFVSPQQFVVTTCGSGGDPKLVAMATDGHRLWEYPAPGSSVWPLLVMAPNGSRLARETLVTDHNVNASAPLGTGDIKAQAVQVFDAASGKVALQAQASPVLDAGGNVAFSPSGRRVAVLMAGGIQVFDLPEPTPLPATPANQTH